MINEEILDILKKQNTYISGQKISEKLDVSRTTVWKAIEKLKKEGYSINAITNKGYKLEADEDILNKYEIEQELKKRNIDLKCTYIDEVDSTNDMAKREEKKSNLQDQLFVAGTQTKARGRRGRAWFSDKNTTIAMTLLLHPDIDITKASMLTLVAATALARVLKKYNIEISIKWPNDLVINKKKVCGILTEMSSDIDGIKYIICGIGLNVSNKCFNDEIKDIATSLYIETKRKYKRKEIIADFLSEFFKLYEEFLNEDNLKFLKAEYTSFLLGNNQDIELISADIVKKAIQIGIDDFGRLLIKNENGIISPISSGEISIRGLYTYK